MDRRLRRARPSPISSRSRSLGSNGAPRQGVRVTWSPSPGGGSVVPEADFTDAEGSAKASWTLGPDLGGQIVTASVRGTDTLFQAWATPPPPADWLEVLEIQPEAVVQEGILRAEVRIWSSWPGTIRLHSPESCLLSIGYPALYSSTGEPVSHGSSGCWTVPTDHPIPQGDTLSREAELGIADVEPGEYTLRFRFDVRMVNGTAATIPEIEIPVSIGG